MLMNKQQTCGFLGWTAYEFDKAVAKGFPARKRTSSRGQDWQVDSREAVAWVVEQEAGKARNGRPPGRGEEPPPGRDVFAEDYRHALSLDDPVDQAIAIALLATVYELPRLVANLASENGLTMDIAFRLSAELTVAVLALWSKQW